MVLSLAVLVGSALVGIVVYVVLFASFSRLLRNSTSTLRVLLLKRTRSPARYFFPLLALIIAVQTTPLPDPLKGRLEHFFTLVLICLLGWLVITLVQVTATLIRMRYSIAVEDNLHARRIHTQTEVLERVFIGCIVVITIAAMLMTFPGARQIGTSVFASAGIAGVIVGMAARSTFASLLAGLQVALTQPIRIDDAVVVEGEWGWIEEIETTYVVVRLWDLRRLILPLTYFIEKPFQNWTHYIGNHRNGLCLCGLHAAGRARPRRVTEHPERLAFMEWKDLRIAGDGFQRDHNAASLFDEREFFFGCI